MLTAELVPARRRGDELLLPKTSKARRERILALGEEVLGLLGAMQGECRDDVAAELDAIDVAPRVIKLLRGLAKLALDACRFEAEEGDDPVALRDALFAASTAARRDGSWERERLITEVASARGLEPARLQRLLFSDLRGTHLLADAPDTSAEQLAARYELALHQAVLLRATGLRVELQSRDAGVLREVYRRLKFHRLMWQDLGAEAENTLALQVDGPAALFSQSTRYGLELAIMLPVFAQATRWSIDAEVLWGRERRPLRFRTAGRRDAFGADAAPPALPDELIRLLEGLQRFAPRWQAEAATRSFDVPGLGVMLPDVRLRRDDGAELWLEILGYWSREAVFRRVDLVRAGVDAPVLFAFSDRLRVDPDVLPMEEGGALLAFKGVLSARRVLDAADALLQHADAAGRRTR